MRRRFYTDRFALAILAVFLLVLSTGCSGNVITSGPIASKTTGEPTLTPTPAAAEPEYRLLVTDRQFLLIPASLPMYDQARSTGAAPVWTLNDQMQWQPADYDVRKVLSITGRNGYETEDWILDIFQVQIGSWTGCCLRRSDRPQDNPSDRILGEIISNELEFAPRSKDYSIVQVFDDLYAVDSQGTVQMISRRHIDGFDFAAAEKKGIGDLFAWYWTSSPVCSPLDNRIFYLTAREQEFYTIWAIDLDKQTESRFGRDTVIRLDGSGSGQLIAYLDQDAAGDPFGKLIDTGNAGQYTLLADKEWEARDGWLYRRDDNRLTLQSANWQVVLETETSYSPLLLGSDILWLSYTEKSWPYMEFLRVDLVKQTCAAAALTGSVTLDDYRQLLKDLESGSLSFDQAAASGISIAVH